MKKLISVLLALTLVFGLTMAVSAASPADSGWEDDDGTFDGWTMNADGSMTLVNGDGSGANDNRLWHGVPDAENFEATVVIDTETNSRPIIKMFGVIIELNAENGNGNQVFVKNMDSNGNWNNFDWLNATECAVTVKLARSNGGNLQVTITGADNATPITMDMTIADPTATGLELAMYGCGNHEKGGIATYTVTLPVNDKTDAGNPQTGDPISVGVIVLTMFAAGTGLVALRKKEN